MQKREKKENHNHIKKKGFKEGVERQVIIKKFSNDLSHTITNSS